MNTDKSKIQKIIYKLSKSTIEDETMWSIDEHSKIKLSFDGEIIGKIYKCDFKGKFFRIYGFTYETYSPDFDKLYKTSGEALVLVDKRGELLWEFPYFNSITDLYETVKYKVAGVEDLLEDLLND